jgi:hypothetical protein
MNSRLTLVFVCDQSHLYSGFLTEFRSADFQVLTARNIAQAKGVLLTRSVNAIIICHDGLRDDRPLAPQLKRTAPDVPIFLFTAYQQPLPEDVDSIWRFDQGDSVVARGMAVFCRNLFKPTPAFGRVLAPREVVSAFAERANGSN